MEIWQTAPPNQSPVETLADLVARRAGDVEPTSDHDLDVDDGVPLAAAYLQVLRDLQHARARVKHLTAALKTSEDMGAAVGLVMVRYLVTRDRAWELLQLASQRQSRKLGDIAGEVVDTGQLSLSGSFRWPNQA